MKCDVQPCPGCGECRLETARAERDATREELARAWETLREWRAGIEEAWPKLRDPNVSRGQCARIGAKLRRLIEL